MAKSKSVSSEEFDKKEARKASEANTDSRDLETNVSELSKSELVNNAVDQETGEVKLGQPGGTDGQSASDRPTMTEEQAREINGYAGFENVAEQRANDPNRPTEHQADTLVKKG